MFRKYATVNCNINNVTTIHQEFNEAHGMLNAPARLVTGACRRDHITPVLRQLLWLPVNRKSISNSRCLFTSHCMVLLRRTSLMTVNSSVTFDVDISGLPSSTCVPCRGHSHRLATGVFLFPDRGHGAIYRQRSGEGHHLQTSWRYCLIRLRRIVTFT